MRRAALLAVVGVVVFFYSSPASAQLSTEAVAGTTIRVNTKADELTTDGDCSLREAIKAANTNKAVDGCAAGSSTDRDTIHFALGNQATITLGSNLPLITDHSGLSIEGQNAKITVSGDDKVGMFFVHRGAKLALLHLTVANAGFRSGLLNDNGQVKVSNSTFSGNSANEGGGGIRNDRGKVALKNTIVANSTNGKNCAKNKGEITDGGYNIEDGTSCSFRAANHSLRSTNPKLASSLANNGGPTKTIALLTGSPAINAIPQATNGCGTQIRTDQRGVSRPQGNRCDIGAFEKRQ
jgi:CSLREA domain-containing protein